MSSISATRKFEWIIENVTKQKLENPSFELYSEKIHIYIGSNNTTWNLLLENREDHIGLYLHRISSDNQDFNVSFNSSDISYVSKDCKDFINSSWGGTINIKNLFYPHSLHSDVYVNEKSQLKLNIEIYLSCLEEEPKLQSTEKFLSKHYGDDKFTDFTLKCSKGEEFHVHRMILADRSNYFKKMFDTEKNQTKSVTFPDIDSFALKEVVKFLYTGNVELKDHCEIKDVLYAAEKFGLASLKTFCIKKLANDVTTKNALSILVISDLYKAKELEIKCLDTIVHNYNYIEGEISNAWILENILLMKKITKAFAKALKSSQFIIKSSL